MEKYKRFFFWGMLVFAAANVINLAHLQWPHVISTAAVDGLRGLCYGLGIGLLIMAVRLKARPSNC